MNRAVLLPTPGSNPFLIQTWLRNYDFWRRPTDRLYVGTTWPQRAEVYKSISDMVLERGGYLIYRNDEYLDHGMALDMLIPMVREELTILMEDDLYVRDPEYVEFLTLQVETNRVGVVGAKRWNGSLELQDIMHRREISGLWPHLLIAKTADLQGVQEHWGAHIWQHGDLVAPLKWRAPATITSDTSIAATIELQTRCSLYEIYSPNVEAAEISSETFHVGSLSSGPLPHPHPGVHPVDAARMHPDSWAQRVAWWRRTLKRSVPGIEELYERHREALDALTKACGHARIVHWAKKYDALVTWSE